MQYFRDNYDRLRSNEKRLIIAAGLAFLAVTGILGCLILYQFIKAPQATTPQPVFAPQALATMTLEPILTEPAFIIETSTPPVPKKILKTPTASEEATAGQSCNYSSPSLNSVLPPVPSGSYSPIEHYSCFNGYWDIGKRDVVDRKTGAWGQDGVLEKVLIKYDSDGNIADRIFIDPEGKQFSGPDH